MAFLFSILSNLRSWNLLSSPTLVLPIQYCCSLWCDYAPWRDPFLSALFLSGPAPCWLPLPGPEVYPWLPLRHKTNKQHFRKCSCKTLSNAFHMLPSTFAIRFNSSPRDDSVIIKTNLLHTTIWLDAVIIILSHNDTQQRARAMFMTLCNFLMSTFLYHTFSVFQECSHLWVVSVMSEHGVTSWLTPNHSDTTDL